MPHYTTTRTPILNVLYWRYLTSCGGAVARLAAANSFPGLRPRSPNGAGVWRLGAFT